MSSPSPDPRRRWRLQFGLGTLFLITFLVSVLAAALGGMLRLSGPEASGPRFVFVLMAAAAPIGVMIGLSLLWSILRRP